MKKYVSAFKSQFLNALRAHPRIFDASRRLAFTTGLRKSSRLAKCLSLYFRKMPTHFLMQIGANDGMTNDPIRAFLTSHDVSAILIEPLPGCFKKLQRNYAHIDRIHPKNVAISYAGTEIVIHHFDEDFENNSHMGRFYQTMASLDKETLVNGIKNDPEALSHIVSTSVPCKTVEQIVSEEGFPKLDTLMLDVEGYEYEILKNLDFGSLDLRMIMFEHILLGTNLGKVHQLLKSHGFELFSDRDDSIACNPLFSSIFRGAITEIS